MIRRGRAVSAGSRNAARRRLALATLRQFRVVFGSVRMQFRDVERRCGISGAQLWLLHEISGDGAAGISALAERLSVHQTTCSGQVEALVAAGLVRKVRRADDRRRTRLELTARGQRLLAQAPGPANGILPEALLGLEGRDLQALSRQLDKLIRRLERRQPGSAAQPLADL